MKIQLLIEIAFMSMLATNVNAQTWSTTGNTLGGSDFLGGLSGGGNPLRIKTEDAQNLNFYTNSGSGTFNNLRMTILGNTNPGFVGIGTTSPSSVLEVDASNYSTGEVVRTVAASGTNSYWRMFGVNSGTTYEFAALYRNNGSLDFQIQASYAASGGGALRFNTGGRTLRMIITGGGDVGMGTS
ncbi:MAG: hypothetical protein IPO83_00845 [Chitinophagaceae bacterium]|nr:hypothetical protein [Chitinophagaceae bacterium]